MLPSARPRLDVRGLFFPRVLCPALVVLGKGKRWEDGTPCSGEVCARVTHAPSAPLLCLRVRALPSRPLSTGAPEGRVWCVRCVPCGRWSGRFGSSMSRLAHTHARARSHTQAAHRPSSVRLQAGRQGRPCASERERARFVVSKAIDGSASALAFMLTDKGDRAANVLSTSPTLAL